MTKNQTTIALVIVALVLVVVFAESAEKSKTINAQSDTMDAQRAEISRATFAWQQDNQRANQLATESNRKSAEISSLKAELRTLQPGATS